MKPSRVELRSTIEALRRQRDALEAECIVREQDCKDLRHLLAESSERRAEAERERDASAQLAEGLAGRVLELEKDRDREREQALTLGIALNKLDAEFSDLMRRAEENNGLHKEARDEHAETREKLLLTEHEVERQKTVIDELRARVAAPRPGRGRRAIEAVRAALTWDRFWLALAWTSWSAVLVVAGLLVWTAIEQALTSRRIRAQLAPLTTECLTISPVEIAEPGTLTLTTDGIRGWTFYPKDHSRPAISGSGYPRVPLGGEGVTGSLRLASGQPIQEASSTVGEIVFGTHGAAYGWTVGDGWRRVSAPGSDLQTPTQGVIVWQRDVCEIVSTVASVESSTR